MSKSCMDFMMFSSYGHGARCEGGKVKREREKKACQRHRETSNQRWGQLAVERKVIQGHLRWGRGKIPLVTEEQDWGWGGDIKSRGAFSCLTNLDQGNVENGGRTF